jgi:hypothetical protein
MDSEILEDVRTLGHNETVTTRILPQPPSIEYDLVRKDVASYLATMVPAFMMLEAIIVKRDKQSYRCMIIIIPESSREDKSFMEEVETGVQDILFTSILESHIVDGRVGLQTYSRHTRVLRETLTATM